MTSQHGEADNINGSTRRGRKGSAQRQKREHAEAHKGARRQGSTWRLAEKGACRSRGRQGSTQRQTSGHAVVDKGGGWRRLEEVVKDQGCCYV